jgi:hypothetical protein
MASREPQTRRDIDEYSLRKPIIFYLSPTRQNDLRHGINSRRDTQSNISASRDRRHENEIRRREEYDWDHGAPARSRATRIESAAASTNSLVLGRSRRHETC